MNSYIEKSDLKVAREYLAFMKVKEDETTGGHGREKALLIRDKVEKQDKERAALIRIDPDVGLFDPYSEVALKHIVDGVQYACEKLDLPLHDGVVSGVMPGPGHQAMVTRLPGTSVGIVTVDRSFCAFTGFLGQLIAQSLQLVADPDSLGIRIDPEETADAVWQQQDLVRDWHHFFSYFAGIGILPTHVASFTDSRRDRIRWDLIPAMETFIVGHEAGHHSEQHGSGEGFASGRDIAKSFASEFSADDFGAKVAMWLGHSDFLRPGAKTPNVWMASLAGAVAYLTAAGVVEHVKAIHETGVERLLIERTHPPVNQRLHALGSHKGFQGHPLAMEYESLRVLVHGLIVRMYSALKPAFVDAHQTGMAKKFRRPDLRSQKGT